MNSTEVYYGPRAALQTEICTPEFYEGKYLVQLVGNGMWDAEGFTTIKEARAEVKALIEAFPGIKVVALR